MKHLLTLTALLLVPLAMLHAADLPDWFEANRVQAHCEKFRLQDESGGMHLHGPIAELGAKAVTLIVDNREEGDWWPSAVGETHPLAANRDVAREIVESVHRNGMKCIGYYRYMSDAWAEREHPEWLCRDAAGQPVLEPRGRGVRQPVYVLCANSWDDYEAEDRSPKPPPCKNVRITLDRDFFSALTATELLTGAKLPVSRKGPLAVEVPDFAINRFVVFSP